MRSESEPQRANVEQIKATAPIYKVRSTRICDDVISERFGEEVVLLNLKTNRFFALNKTGARLWELLASGEQLDEIEKKLHREFDVDEAELTANVQRMLKAMERERLVRFEQG